MITINDKDFYEEPASCGTCPFLFVPGRDAPSFFPTGKIGKCHCVQFDEWHHTWAGVPLRCKKLFKKAFSMPDGSVLVIVKNGET